MTTALDSAVLDAPERLRVQTGGAVPNECIYVTRAVHRTAARLLGAGELCTVFDTRQVGKTSLVQRLMVELETQGFPTLYVECAGQLSGNTTMATWFRALANRLWRELANKIGWARVPEKKGGNTEERRRLRRARREIVRELEAEFDAWWDERRDDPAARLEVFLTERLVEGAEELIRGRRRHIVIFVDECDAALTKPWSDAFFLLVRTMYIQRALDDEASAAYRSFCFCLVGAVTSRELVKDDVTPFNIGHALTLTDFNPADGDDLGQIEAYLTPEDDRSLEERAREGCALLRAVLHWTGGHPFLTMTLCEHVKKNAIAPLEVGDEARRLLERSVGSEQPVSGGRGNHLSSHFAWINAYLADETRAPNQAAVFALYRSILRRGHAPDLNTVETNVLKLSGIVKNRPSDGHLMIRNELYRYALGRDWLKVVEAGFPWRKLILVLTAFAILTGLIVLGVWRWDAYRARQEQMELAARNEFEAHLDDVRHATSPRDAEAAARAALEMLRDDVPHDLTTDVVWKAVDDFWLLYSKSLQLSASRMLGDEEARSAQGLLLLLASDMVAGQATLRPELQTELETVLGRHWNVPHPEWLSHSLRGHGNRPLDAAWIARDRLAVVDGSRLYVWSLDDGRQVHPPLTDVVGHHIVSAGEGWACVHDAVPWKGKTDRKTFRISVLRGVGTSAVTRVAQESVVGVDAACGFSDGRLSVVVVDGSDELRWWTLSESQAEGGEWGEPSVEPGQGEELVRVRFEGGRGQVVAADFESGAVTWAFDGEQWTQRRAFEGPLQGRRASYTDAAAWSNGVVIIGEEVVSWVPEEATAVEPVQFPNRWFDLVRVRSPDVTVLRYRSDFADGRFRSSGVSIMRGRIEQFYVERTQEQAGALSVSPWSDTAPRVTMSFGDDVLRVWTLSPDLHPTPTKTGVAEVWLHWQRALGLTLDDDGRVVSLGSYGVRSAGGIPGAHSQWIRTQLAATPAVSSRAR